MARLRDERGPARCLYATGQDAQLFVGAVRVLLTLQAQNGDGDITQERRDVERSESGVEPRAIPAVERDIDVVVVAHEPAA